VLLAAGCGGEEPAIQRDLAGQLATQSMRVAADLDSENFCDARNDVAVLQERTIAAINAGRIPAELQEELLAKVNVLVEAVTCTPPAAADGSQEEARDLAEWLRDRAD
jgi:hypothetical protein